MTRIAAARWGLAVAVVLLLGLSQASAQEVIKVQIANNAVLVPVRIHDHELNFLLDTGSEHSAISASAAQRLGLVENGSTEIIRDYRTQAAREVANQPLMIGKRVFTPQALPVIKLDSVSAALGGPVDGVLGNDVLQTFAFRLNYSRKELTLIAGPHVGRLGGRTIDLHRRGNEFYVPMLVASVPVELLLDSGTNSTSLSWSTWESVSHVWQPNSVIDGVVRAGFPIPPAFLVCLPRVGVGDATLSDQVVRVQRKVSSGAFSAPDFGGILGSEFLRQFEITFDLPHSRLFLKKDMKYRRDSYRFTTIGIQFAKDGDGRFDVMGVWRNSPAEEAGIRGGDLIRAVNGKTAAALSTEEFASQLHGPAGTPVRLIIRRNTSLFAVTLYTRQLLCSPHNVQDTLRAEQR